MTTSPRQRRTKPQPTGPTKVERVIREPEFARRLEQACDAHPMVPPKHSGRLGWVQRELQRRFNQKISTESVRKWFAGEAKPRPDKMTKLAQALEVDVAWLSLGVSPDMEPRERRMRNAMADGAVNLVAGLIQMDGGYPAFPTETDSATRDPHVDLHAIIKGAKYDLHVSLGVKNGRAARFVVPTKYQGLVVLGVLKTGFNFEIFEISPDIITTGDFQGGSIEVVADISKLSRIESFSSRI